MPPRFSIIICSHRPERARFIREHYANLFRDYDHECILIPDASSLAEGHSRATRQAKGRFLIFSHDDIEFVRPDVPGRLERYLGQFDVVGIAGTTNLIDGAWASAGDPYCFGLVIYPEPDNMFELRCHGAGDLCVSRIQALDGCFFACRRNVAEAVGFDATTFDGFHLYDLDFTFGAYLKGFRLAVCRDLALIHASKGNHDATWQMYRERFEAKYRAHLSQGSSGHCRQLRARLPKEKLAWFCEPEGLRQLIRKLG